MISWKPNIYFNKGVGLNYSENYLAECIKYGDNLNSNNLPVIFSLKHLSEILNVSYGYLNDIVNREANYYKDFLIKKNQVVIEK